MFPSYLCDCQHVILAKLKQTTTILCHSVAVYPLLLLTQLCLRQQKEEILMYMDSGFSWLTFWLAIVHNVYVASYYTLGCQTTTLT